MPPGQKAGGSYRTIAFIALLYSILNLCLNASISSACCHLFSHFVLFWYFPWFFLSSMLYYHPLQNPKNQGLIGVSPIPGVKWIECSWPSTRKTKLKENWKMNKQYYQSRTGFITQSALIAALYVVLTMIVAPIAFGPIQFRVSEVLCVLPYFLTSAVLDW